MKRNTLYIILFLLSESLSGQDIFVKAEYPGAVVTGEQFTVMFTVNSDGGEFTGPSFIGFYKLGGPNTSYTSNSQWINGKFSQQTSYIYVYYLQAMNPGRFSIPPATFRYKNKDYKSDSVIITVIKNVTSTQTGTNNTAENVQTGDLPQGGSELFINLSLSRNEVYIGEHIIASIKLFTKVELAGLNEVKFPSFNGFLKENLETPPLRSLARENINGSIYGTGLIQQFLLYPQITGEITVNPVEITALLQQRSGQTDPFFGDFFANYQTVPKVLASQPVKIKVKPLPGDKPEDFSGVVGKLDISAGINRDTINVNDAINYKIVIKGNGNLKLAGAPALKFSPDIEVYDPKVTENITNSTGGSTGQKTFEYLLIPRHHGNFTIPSVTYSYFNTSKKQYERLTTKEITFHAKKIGDQGNVVTVVSGVSKEDIKYVGKDIRFIKTTGEKLRKEVQLLISKQYFFTIYGFSLLLFLAILFFRREQIRRNSDISIVRNRKAAKIAGNRLKRASEFLKSGTLDGFYEEILKALWGYLSDKLSIPLSELTRNSAVDILKTKGIDEESIKNLAVILDKCEFARFSPASSGTEASDIYLGALAFIKTVENSIN